MDAKVIDFHQPGRKQQPRHGQSLRIYGLDPRTRDAVVELMRELQLRQHEMIAEAIMQATDLAMAAHVAQYHSEEQNGGSPCPQC